MSSLIQQLKAVNTEISRLQELLRQLKSQKKKIQESLFRFMEKNNIKTMDGVKLKTVAPKDVSTVTRKTPAERKRDGISVLRNLGVNDPEKTWEILTSTKVEN